ncbi:MAG: transposase family protein [Desulfobacter sp.]|nr:transposase family protein [Desulfobacter sp.]
MSKLKTLAKRKRWLSKFLSLPHGIPSHDTFGRIFERMNPNEFQSSFMHFKSRLQNDQRSSHCNRRQNSKNVHTIPQ